MSAKEDGGAAFPRPLPKIETSPEEAFRIIESYSGMSLRDYFAAKAIESAARESEACENAEYLAESAYRIADAMLAQRIN